MASSTVSSLCAQGYCNPKNYEKSRPSYLREAVTMLLEKCGVCSEVGESKKEQEKPPKTVLELGAGTGKFTRIMKDVLKGTNVQIVASDPLESMCQQFRNNIGDVEMLQFAADNIQLPDASVDVVVAANALHWFANRPKSFDEIRRVLAPDGMLGMIWCFPNINTPSHWIQESFDYMRPMYEVRNEWLPMGKLNEILSSVSSTGYFTQIEGDQISFQRDLDFDFEKAHQHFSSYSAIASSETVKCDFRSFLDNLFEKNFRSKGIELKSILFDTPIFWCKIKDNQFQS